MSCLAARPWKSGDEAPPLTHVRGCGLTLPFAPGLMPRATWQLSQLDGAWHRRHVAGCDDASIACLVTKSPRWTAPDWMASGRRTSTGNGWRVSWQSAQYA
jgi:hypothetical protein